MADEEQKYPAPNLREPTLGMRRVRLAFNPSGNATVDQVKRRSAELIDLCDNLTKSTNDEEARRNFDLAMDAYEDAAMWAVKGATA